MGKYSLHEIRISFEAPPIREMKQESLTIQKDKEFEANFQWMKYAILFTDKGMNWYTFITPLYPWGSIQKGGQELYASDSLGKNIDKSKEVKIPPAEVEKEFESYLKKPELEPKTQVSYINGHQHDRKTYSSEEFKRDFIDSGRYILLTRDRKFTDPFGKVIGKEGVPKMSNVYKQAVKLAKEKDYFTGGFDIMKKLVKKQHQEQEKSQKKSK